jgi:hypothetical protein
LPACLSGADGLMREGSAPRKNRWLRSGLWFTVEMQYLPFIAYIKAQKAPYCTTSRNR